MGIQAGLEINIMLFFFLNLFLKRNQKFVRELHMQKNNLHSLKKNSNNNKPLQKLNK